VNLHNYESALVQQANH